ncbi:hypothetical protein K438DRAFT_2145867 [Mycena galopus ATCC 62051]|nr:hypothetical protein K438DRAFT_2145867 [Mycena galopus ATCC 62051]
MAEVLVPIDLAGRNPILPKLYWSYYHPLVIPGQSCIVMIYDTSPKAMRTLHDWEKTQKIPKGTDEELRAQGLLQAPQNILFFARALGNPDGRQDALQAWQTAAEMVDAHAKDQLRAAADAAMGPSELITLEPPVRREDGTWTGGLAIERGDGHCKPVKTGTRCYTIANSYQNQKKIWGPAQGSKVNGAFDDNNLLRRNLNIAVAPFAMTAMQQMPPETRQVIEDHASMLNIPPLGIPGNIAHNTLQLNVAPAVAHDSEDTLEGALGFYGGNHLDKFDSPGRFTNMTMCSRLPDDYTLSQFHIIRFGIYFVLRNFDSANFCGLNCHGGTPPIAPPGTTVANDAYRLTFISYPPENMGDGLGHVVVGALPTARDSVLKMSAEMQHTDCESHDTRAFTRQANFAADGQVVMDVRAHVIFMARMFLLLIIFMSNQLPRFYNIQIDSDRFLSAFSFAVGETRETVGPWSNGPGYRAPNPAPSVDAQCDISQSTTLVPQEVRRSAIKRAWRLHYNLLASYIPYAVVQKKRFNIDDTGALLTPGILVTPEPLVALLDAMGNPIEAGGRPYRKPTPPKPAGAPKPRKRKRDNADHGNPDDTSGSADGEGQLRRLKRNCEGKAVDASMTDGENVSSGRIVQVSGKPREHSAVWRTQTYIEMDNIWSDPAAVHSSDSFAAVRLDPALCVDWHECQLHPADITLGQDGDGAALDKFFYDAVELKLVGRLRSSVIRIDHSAVQGAYHHLRSNPLPHHIGSPLSDAFEGIMHSPNSVETSIRISRIWNHCDHLIGSGAAAALELKLQRQSLMLTTWCVWSWLDSFCVQVVTRALREPHADDGWITRLTKHVQTLTTTCGDSRELCASEFGLDGLDAVYPYRQRGTLDLEVPDSHIIALVLDIIAHWLSFPTRTKSRVQAWFVDAMVSACDPSTLFLDSVWYAFNHIEIEVFGDKSFKISSPAAFDGFRSALQGCKLSNTSSEEFLLLNDIQAMLHQYRTATIAASKPASPRLLLTSSDSRELSLMNRLLEALLELEPLIDGYNTIATPTLLQSRVNSKLDHLLPFREHGPSRSRSRLPGNSFDPAHARTWGGLFSGLIFRAIIFATSFSMQATTYFVDPTAWESEYARFPGRDLSFFYNSHAYGGAKSNRGLYLIDKYWTALNTAGCPDWELNTASGTYDFMECYKFLKADNPSRFKEIGPLLAFLLAADFSYSGAVAAPDVSTVGWIVRDMNKGAMTGLEQLELIPMRRRGSKNKPGKGNIGEVRAGFLRLYQFLDAKLSDVSKTHMGFDPIMVENSLCKWTRWVQLNLVSLIL